MPTPPPKKATRPRKATTPRTAPPSALDTPGLTAEDAEWVAVQERLAAAPDSDAQIEVIAETLDVPDGCVAVPLGQAIVHILPRGQWRSSTIAALQMGDFEGWSSQALAPGEYQKIWLPMDPTIDEITDMFDAWGKLTGQDPGKAPVTPTSLRRMRMR